MSTGVYLTALDNMQDSIFDFAHSTVETVKSLMMVDIRREIRGIKSEIYALNQERAERNEANRIEYIGALQREVVSQNADHADVINAELSNIKKSEDKQIYLENIISVSTNLNSYLQLVDKLQGLSQYVDIDVDKYRENFISYSKKAWTKSNIEKLNIEIKKEISTIDNWIKDNRENILKMTLPKEYHEFFIQEGHVVEDPVKYFFVNHILQYMVRYEDEKDTAINQNNELLDIANNLAEILEEINGLNIFGKDYEEVDNAFKSAVKILNNDELGFNDKYNMSTLRYQILRDYYLEFKNKYKGFIDKKLLYDTEYKQNQIMSNYLGRESVEYNLSVDGIDKQIASLHDKNNTLSVEYGKKKYVENTRNKIHEHLLYNNYKLIGSTVIYNEFANIYRELYSLGNGVILEVNISDNYSFSYKVLGAKVPGYSINNQGLVNAKNKVCPKMKALLEELSLHKAEEFVYYGPNEYQNKEIELPDYVPEHFKNHVYMERKVYEQQALKHMEM